MILENILGYEIDWAATAAFLALPLALFNLWYSLLRKGKPSFTCSIWTAIQLIQNNSPRAAFAVKISMVNDGKKVLKIFDLYLEVTDSNNKKYYYEPIVLWDLTAWIAAGNVPNRVGLAQKGQVPLPIQVNPESEINFGYSLMFLPEDINNVLNPNDSSSVNVKLFVRASNKTDYYLIGTQKFSSKDLEGLKNNSFVSIKSDETTKERKKVRDRKL